MLASFALSVLGLISKLTASIISQCHMDAPAGMMEALVELSMTRAWQETVRVRSLVDAEQQLFVGTHVQHHTRGLGRLTDIDTSLWVNAPDRASAKCFEISFGDPADRHRYSFNSIRDTKFSVQSYVWSSPMVVVDWRLVLRPQQLTYLLLIVMTVAAVVFDMIVVLSSDRHTERTLMVALVVVRLVLHIAQLVRRDGLSVWLVNYSRCNPASSALLVPILVISSDTMLLFCGKCVYRHV